MLSIAKFSSAPDPAAYYLEVIANESVDHYLASGEAPGRWIGTGAERLGLIREVEADALRSVVEGVDLSSGGPVDEVAEDQGIRPDPVGGFMDASDLVGDQLRHLVVQP